jgi:uncharacterized membrane protein (UPF0127 family)
MVAFLSRPIVLVAALVLVAVASAGRADGALSRLTIEGTSGRHAFMVEVARTVEERAQGLMYRRSLAPDRGMIFDFGAEADIAMWMRNTYIPLDMLFVRADGVIHRVQRDTVPFSEETISAGAPVRYVVELPAGTAKRLGIDRGDRVLHEIIER